MRDSNRSGALPLRPLTTAELLDAAVALLRTRAALLLTLGFVVALGEQAVLLFLRQWADVVDGIWPNEDLIGEWLILMVVGFATEAFCIAILGAFAASAAPRAMLGRAAPARPVRAFSTVVTALLVALLTAVAGAVCLLWPVAYLLLGLAVPAVIIDRLGPGRALLRSIRLSSRGGMRAGWIRLLGYSSWMIIRLATGLGGVYVLGLVLDRGTAIGDHLVTGGAWLMVNAIAYPVLACLDAALHVETRMRTEGLDITLSRALDKGVSTEAALAVPRGLALPRGTAP